MRFPRLQFLSAVIVPIISIMAVCAAILHSIGLEYVAPKLYALDDAYIHMTLAKQIDLHGVYGLTPHESSTPSSSILWPIFLVVARWIMPPIYGPWFVNILGLIFCSWVIAHAINSEEKNYPFMKLTLILTAVLMILPAPALLLGGMEHVWHFAFMLLLFLTSIDYLSKEPRKRSFRFAMPLLAATLSISMRYESVFLIIFIAAAGFATKRYKFAFYILGAAFIPVALFSMFALKQGGYLLPLSTISKSIYTGTTLGVKFRTIIVRIADMDFQISAPLQALVLFSIVLLVHGVLAGNRRIHFMNLFFVCATITHFLFAELGWLFRYEAYLVGIGVIVFLLSGIELLKIRRQLGPQFRGVVLMITGLILVGCSLRAYRGVKYTTQAIRDRMEEHVPIAEFIHQYYRTDTLILGDVGLTSYLNDNKILDVYGLASKDACAEILKNRAAMGSDSSVGPDFLRKWQQNNTDAKIAILKKEWVGSFPKEWLKVARFNIESNIVFSDFSPLFFFAFEPSEAELLRKNLEEFVTTRPMKIQWEPVK